ncbi:MAG: LPS assembly protein LptD, partial [Gammaproteobacteria bacterium]|nr:LPS assembly protein LptD [Gammaproteobacteria bacterium]
IGQPGGLLRSSLLIFLLWTVAARDANAAPPEAFGCPLPAPSILSMGMSDPGADPNSIDVITGDVEVDLNGPATFKDRVVMRQGNRELGADSARYDQESGEFSAAGNIEFRDPATWVKGNAARYNATTGLFSIEGAVYELYTVPARGSADRIALEASEQLSLTNVTYTTCAAGKDDWLLRASSISVDRETGTGTARNARLEFKGVPILYAPYLTYPVDNQRKSGLLLPDVGNSSQRGVELEVPYYFNLAPNYDATLTPHYMSRRGLQAKGEFRYLSGGTSGFITGEFLPNDDVTDDNRGLLSWFNQSQLPAGWRSTLDATDVSDTAYYEDLSNGLAATSQTHVHRRLDFEMFDETWFVRLRLEDYETLDEAIVPEDEPYRMMPQLTVNGSWPNAPLGLEPGMTSEITYFDRSTGITGLRSHFLPEISLPLQLGPLLVEPSVGLDYTIYSLREVTPGEDDSPSRSVPLYSVDMRTVLERVWSNGGKWLQTLEPRAQFVHIPFEDQGDLPVFDTIEPDFNLVQLFRRKRYVGLDRLSDTDQLSLGITTRLIRSEDGSQFLTATIGETQYFSSRDVALPGDPPNEDSTSDYIAELGMNVNDRWNVDLGYQWDSDANVTRLAEARVLYRHDDFRILNLSYRFRRDSVREVDVAGAWPLADRWSIVGRYDYSLLDNQALERFIGLEYSTCCWGVRLVTRRYLTSRDGESDSAITLQLLLKGFGSSGTPAERMLDRGILGYDRFDRY